jgi:AraC-like DNA-binding protein
MHYLALWRMQMAAGLLVRGDQQVAQVAEAVGYESEAAFNRAFRRPVGMPPASWGKARLTGQAPALTRAGRTAR